MGPVGVGAEAATTANLGADIYTYSVNEGAFIGASVEGAVIYPRAEWNHAYYGDPGATARGIVLEGRYANPQADALRRALAAARSEEHTSELQSLMRISYAVFCLKKKNTKQQS